MIEGLPQKEVLRLGFLWDYWTFDAYFFDSLLKDPEFHKEIIELVESQERFVGIAAPRGHAKTTRVSVRHNLWLMLHAKEPYILQVSDTYTQACSVISAIRYQIDNNSKLRKFFKPEIVKETQDTLVLKTVYGRSRISARGAGQSLRGILDDAETRPTLTVCDDLEEDSRVENPQLRDEDWQWFWKVLLPAGAKGSKFRVIGSILHKAALLKRLIEHSDWKCLRYSEQLEEGITLWPEHKDWEQSEKVKEQYREAGQLHTWYCEYMNDPIDAEDAEFKTTWIQVVSLEQKTLEGLIVTSTVDPAISKKDTACYTGIVTVAWGRTNPPLIYVIDVRRGRWGVYETVEQMFKVKHAFNVSRFGIEKVQYQAALQEVFEMEQQRRQDFVSVDPLEAADTHKEARIRAMHQLYAKGCVKWAQEFPILREEHMSFPHGVTKDCIDAEAYQIRMVNVSPSMPKPKHPQNSGAALIDSVMKRKTHNRLGAY